ncbi:putative glutaredoxin [Vairimorpha necatrix]|uniref:Glutaredoxin n=1 Tax=Vairimorpha necatrix TaxID=6039 RepID=A0AAX4JEJ8_9MICR
MESLTLEKALQDNENFMIFLKECPFCYKAEKILKSNKVKFEKFNKDKYKTLTEEAQNKYSYRTFPLIVLDRKFIGGCSDLSKIFEN